MYLGIDFLIAPDLRLFVVEVNVGLPGGAHEFNLTHLVRFERSSDIFERIERTSQNAHGRSFSDYLHSLPFVESLKELKIWMDGMGPFPQRFHPGLRLEDKWVQYQLLKGIVPMPETQVYEPGDLSAIEAFFKTHSRGALKRRVARGGRDFRIVTGPEMLEKLKVAPGLYLLQEYVQSKADGYTLSIRSIAFAGEFMCMYANLSTRIHSNHGILAFVMPATFFGLSRQEFKTHRFDQKSWEAKIWFGENDPAYLRHNLYEDEVAEALLLLPEPLFERIKELSVRVERLYDGLDFDQLPKACFEP